MGYLTRDEILKADDIQFFDVPVPEWGGTVRIRGLSGFERDDFEASVIDQRGRKTRIKLSNLRAKLVALSVVNGNGERLFSEKDVRVLGQKSAAALQRVFEAAQRLSGISDEDVEELTQNLESGQGDDSTSD